MQTVTRMSVWLLIWLAFVTMNKGRSIPEGATHVTWYTQTSGGSLKCLNTGGPMSHVSWMGVYTCIFLIKVFTALIRVSGHCACVSAQSCPTLSDPTDCSPPDSSALGIPKARILEWVAISFSRVSSRPKNRTHISCISCTGTVPPRKPTKDIDICGSAKGKRKPVC